MANEDGTFVNYYGKLNEWRVYRLSDGTLVGYKSKLRKTGTDEETGKEEFDKVGIERVVTNTTDFDKFGDFVDSHEPKAKRYDPYKDDNQTRIEVPITPRAK